MLVTSPRASSFVGLVLVLACTPIDPDAGDELGESAGESTDAATDDASMETGETAALTYWRDVRPILSEHCVGCHYEGGIAPLRLDGFEHASPFAALIASATAERAMPPYGVDNGGDCHTFRDARWLSDDELATLAGWAELGAPAGDPADAPPDPPPASGLEGEIRTLVMPDPYVPDDTLSDDYRCFVIDGVAPADATTFVTGFDVRPGNAQIAHHVIVWAPRSLDAAAQAEALDAAEPGQGYTCFGTAQVPASVVAAWAPGGVASHYPDEIGIELVAGAPLIVQMHYNTLAGPGMQDQTAIDLQVVAGGVTPARFVGLADLDLALAPGLSEVETTHVGTLAGGADTALRVHGVFPHMHTLGRELELARADDASCLISVPRYEFHWQLLYFYEQAVELPVDAMLSLRCAYDTSSREQTTFWGEGTQDEMCIAGLLVSAIE
jgi:hypothetical protein